MLTASPVATLSGALASTLTVPEVIVNLPPTWARVEPPTVTRGCSTLTETVPTLMPICCAVARLLVDVACTGITVLPTLIEPDSAPLAAWPLGGPMYASTMCDVCAVG